MGSKENIPWSPGPEFKRAAEVAPTGKSLLRDSLCEDVEGMGVFMNPGTWGSNRYEGNHWVGILGC